MAARDFASAYLAGQARDIYPGTPDDAEARRQAVTRAARPLAPAVAEALAAQGRRLPPSPRREANLGVLARGAAAVVTGQQVGLFLGPLYTLYKAASAVAVARALAAESGAPVVPIFWLQTEDHDLPEIQTCGLPGRLLHLDDEPGAVSIAHRTLPAGVDAVLAVLKGELTGTPHGPAHLARLARHYRPGAPWGQAFAGLLAELFADEGLVIVDPRDPALAEAARPVHRRALTDAVPIAAALETRAAQLAAAGFAAPVAVRPGAPLSFVHPDGPEGPRRRVTDGAPWLSLLEQDPRAFSTSALLRPILQDTLLPTAAYVGGPGELAYFAQLPPLYAAYGLPCPLLLMRARFQLVDPGTRGDLEQLGLAAADCARPEEDLLARAATPIAGAEVTARLLEPFLAALDQLAPTLTRDAPQLERAVARTRAAVTRNVGRLADKARRAALYRDPARVAAVRRVRAALFPGPGGTPQERVYGLPWFAAQVGDRALVERVLAAVRPYDPTLQDLAT